MIEIHKINDVEIIKSLAINDKFDYNDKNVYLGVFCDNEVIEYLCYEHNDNDYNIISISDKSGDFQLILGLVKTLIFLGDIGKKETIFLPLEYERVAKSIGFDMKDAAYELKINEYHTKCVKC